MQPLHQYKRGRSLEVLSNIKGVSSDEGSNVTVVLQIFWKWFHAICNDYLPYTERWSHGHVHYTSVYCLPPDVMSETRCWERDGKDGDRLGAG